MRYGILVLLVGCAASEPYCVGVSPVCDDGTPVCRIGALRYVGSRSAGSCVLTGILPGSYPTCNAAGEAECPHEGYTLHCLTDDERSAAPDDCDP